MILFKKAADISAYLDNKHHSGSAIAFVPTMGALHQGHLQLLKAIDTTDAVKVASIFVNPTQFNDPNDLEKYPVTLEQDIRYLSAKGCDVLFLPDVQEMYPQGKELPQPYELGKLEELWEGEFRPGHFQGVCQVVDRLLHIVGPSQLFMGQKDFQQCMVIRKLLELKYPNIQLNIVPTVREKNGLAMSSRNMRLSEEGKEKAAILFRVLTEISAQLSHSSFEELIQNAKQKILAAGFEKIDYLAICDPNTLLPVSEYEKGRSYVIIVAAFLEGVRLIDNIVTDLNT